MTMADQSIDNNVTEKSADSKAELALCRILCVPKQSTVIPTTSKNNATSASGIPIAGPTLADKPINGAKKGRII